MTETSHKYNNPLMQARHVGFLQSIEEGEELSKTGSGSENSSEVELEVVSNSSSDKSDPFIKRMDSTRTCARTLNSYFYRTKSMPASHYNSNNALRTVDEEERAESDGDGSSGKARSLSQYFRRNPLKSMSATFRQSIRFAKSRRSSSSGSSKDSTGTRKAQAHKRDCLGTANRVLQFILMLLAILFIVLALLFLANVAKPAKTVLIRVGNLLGEKSIELKNVTITNTNLEGVHIPNLGDMLGDVFKVEPLPPPPKIELPPPPKMEGNVFSMVEDAIANSVIEMKDAKREQEDAFMSWCENAPCTKSFRKKCPSVGRGLQQGQKNGVPVIPFPREFCAAMRQLNKKKCMCDENIMQIPEAERLTQSSTLIATMCGYRNELTKCN